MSNGPSPPASASVPVSPASPSAESVSPPPETSPAPALRQPADRGPEPTDVALALSGSDRKFLVVSAAAILVLMGVYLIRARAERPAGIGIIRPPANEIALRLDINRATWVEWMQMEGIGETMARNIVADRESKGPFRSIDDLSRVRGIGDVILARLRPRLQCRDCPADPPPGN